MKIFLLKDVEKVGMSGEIIEVSEGFGRNFLIPRQLGVEVTPSQESNFLRRARVIEHREEVIESKTSILAERLKSLTLTIKKKVHDGDKLYAAIAPTDIVDLLAAQGISVAKNQILLDKSIKKVGVYPVTIKLSSRLCPVVKIKIVAQPA